MSAKIFGDYDRAGLDAQYDNRAKVPAFPEYLARFKSESAAARDQYAGRMRLDVPVGPGPTERVDIFPAAGPGLAPVLVFIHGGYWLMLDKEDFSFVAKGFVPHGITTVVINYALIPSVRMAEVVRQCRQATAWVLAGAAGFGADPDRVAVAGHSAGGHLTAMVAATDWESFTAPLVPTPVRSRPIGGVSLSGLHDLLPISRCYLQESLHPTELEVERYSPMRLPPPRSGSWLALVGEKEGPEYHRQSTELAKRWTAAGAADVRARIAAGHDHFSIMMALADPDDPITLEIVRQVRQNP